MRCVVDISSGFPEILLHVYVGPLQHPGLLTIPIFTNDFFNELPYIIRVCFHCKGETN